MPQNFCEITTLNVHVVPAKSTVEISQNLVAFSEYMNFNVNQIFFGPSQYITTLLTQGSKYIIKSMLDK